ncbi:MAG: DUF3368 domain-containing protein [Planctomycetota bacterium]
MDAGEAAVIELALERHAAFILMDERKGRKIAREVYGLQVMGTARLLVEAKHRGVQINLAETLKGMRACGYWIHDDIVAFALKAAGET